MSSIPGHPFDPPTDPTEFVGRVPFVPWESFDANWEWTQGQHVTLIGPNGRGKTNLMTHILPRREYTVFLGTKRQDSTQDALTDTKGAQRYKVAEVWEDVHQDVSHKWMLRPPFPKNATVAELKRLHASIFGEALMKIFRVGHWCIAMDEIRYLTDYLGIEDVVQLLLLQGRSLKISIVSGTQRPRHVPLEAYSMASHLFFWQTPDHQDVSRVAELASVGRETIMEVVPKLDANKHEVLYVDVKTGYMAVTIPPPPVK